MESLQSLDKKAIFDILQRSQGKLSVKKIRNLARAAFQRKIPEYHLSRLLRWLSQDGLVSFNRGGWSVCCPSTSSLNSLDRVHYPILSPAGVNALSFENIKTNNDIDLTKKNSMGPENHAQKIFEEGGPWSKFRKLISYYKACIRNETGAEASAFLNEYGRRYLFISQVGGWYPKAGKLWRYTIPLTSHLKDFIKELSQAGDSAVVVLGYPLQAIHVVKENEPDVDFIRPVFQYHLQTDFNNGSLTLSVSNDRPEICLDWLKYAFSSPGQQRNFLSACGLINNSKVNGDGGQGLPNLNVLASTLSAFLSQKIKEPLVVESLTPGLLDSPFETGIYNKAVIMIGSRARFTKTLLHELSAIEKVDDKTLDTTALRFIFRTNNKSISTKAYKSQESCVIDTDLMNANQRQSVASLLQKDLTVITGPPGTGKSQVVCSGIANLRLTNKTTIFASRNHKAIDAVVNRFLDKQERPLIVRANSKEDPSLKYTLIKAIRDLLSANYNEDYDIRYNKISIKIKELLEKRGVNAEVADEIQTLREKLGEFEEQLNELGCHLSKETLSLLDQQPEKYPSVIIRNLYGRFFKELSCKNNSELSKKILLRVRFVLLTPFWIHTRYKLRKFNNFSDIPILLAFTNTKTFYNYFTLLLKATQYVDIKQKVFLLEDNLKSYPNVEKLTASIGESTAKIKLLAEEALALDNERRKGVPIDNDLREKMSILKIALKAKNSGMVEDRELKKTDEMLQENISNLLHHFPSWAVTNLSVGSRLPLIAGMFDMAIIDEASQSDIPSAIPILFRAKRGCAVGDPQQLAHTSNLPVAKDTLLRKRVGLSSLEDLKYSYIETSLYDLFVQSPNVNPLLLNYTYRSVGDIAQYSNSTFYDGELRVATDLSRMKVPENCKLGINWTAISGDVKSAGGGGCFCVDEIDAIVKFVCEILSDGSFKGSLGIVTPFRQQANRIDDALYQSDLSFAELDKAQVHVDTSHGFQGDEKDVMIFSLCAGPNMPTGSRAFLRETPNLFNVAASRARAVLHIFGNRQWAENCGIKHISNLANHEHRSNYKPKKCPWSPHESPWEEILYKALLKRGIETVPQYPVLGRRLDIALVKGRYGKVKVDIEVDGDRYHRNSDGSRKKDDVWRDLQLQGIGWTVVRFWVYQLREDLDGCVEKIVNLWSNNEQ